MLLIEEQTKGYSRTHLVILIIAELDEVETFTCRFEQHRFFYINGKKNRPRCRLDPVVSDGIMRVVGRIDRSELSYEANHPVIFTAKSDPD